MARDEHNKAAEHHENAAKSHRAAAEHHGKGDHAKGNQGALIRCPTTLPNCSPAQRTSLRKEPTAKVKVGPGHKSGPHFMCCN
jgi:hypothetical protein